MNDTLSHDMPSYGSHVVDPEHGKPADEYYVLLADDASIKHQLANLATLRRVLATDYDALQRTLADKAERARIYNALRNLQELGNALVRVNDVELSNVFDIFEREEIEATEAAKASKSPARRRARRTNGAHALNGAAAH